MASEKVDLPGETEKTPAKRAEIEREKIISRQPTDAEWKGYKPGDKVPLAPRSRG